MDSFNQLYFVFAVKSDITVHQNAEPQSSEPPTETPDGTAVKPDAQTATTQEVSEILDVASEILEVTPSVEPVKKGKELKRRTFGKLFKKKSDRTSDNETVKEKEKQSSNEDQLDVGQVPPDPQQVRNILIKMFFVKHWKVLNELAVALLFVNTVSIKTKPTEGLIKGYKPNLNKDLMHNLK